MHPRHSAFLLLCGAATACACSSSDGGSSAPAGGRSSSVGGTGGAIGNGGATSAGGTANQAGSSGSTAISGGFTSGGFTSGGLTSGGSTSGGSTSGGSTSGGAGGSPPSLASCPLPPVGAPDNAVKALNAINTLRLAMGVECANLVLTLDKSAQAHCDYYAANAGNAICEGGSIIAHYEIPTCTGFTGADPGARVKAASYVGQGWSEVMAFNNDPNKAVDQWINSVWHRTPLLSPWWDDMGYGNAAKCDVIDQGPGKQSPPSATAMYPYAGQTGVPLSFNGAEEGPEPPSPPPRMGSPTGWPSGPPITLYVQQATTVSHSIEVMGSGVPLLHQWIDYKQLDNDSDQLILYTDQPLSANTTYHVTIAVTISGSGAPKTFDWTFTTGS